ncbi:MAG TPA: hypothetical protein VLS48_06960, partial [Anaerolineales bacterium]|nr:hypothetical protein [Anaerolineales bacterium]
FVVGILEAYWEAYEAVGLNVYADYDYLCQVWSYHQAIVDALQQGDIEASYQAFVDHKDLLYLRPVANGFNNTEGRSTANRRSQEVVDLRPNPEI